MMNHMHDHMMMHKHFHFEKAHRGHMMAKGICCIMTVGIGIAAVCYLKSKSGKEMREQMRNGAIETAECLMDVVEHKIEKAKKFVADAKEKIVDAGAEI